MVINRSAMTGSNVPWLQYLRRLMQIEFLSDAMEAGNIAAPVPDEVTDIVTS
jgi:hypothetical protein